MIQAMTLPQMVAGYRSWCRSCRNEGCKGGIHYSDTDREPVYGGDWLVHGLVAVFPTIGYLAQVEDDQPGVTVFLAVPADRYPVDEVGRFDGVYEMVPIIEADAALSPAVCREVAALLDDPWPLMDVEGEQRSFLTGGEGVQVRLNVTDVYLTVGNAERAASVQLFDHDRMAIASRLREYANKSERP